MTADPPAPEPPDAGATRAVYRIDDNANVFLVRDGLTQAEADRLAAEFQARGHKQTYWVEREPGGAGAGDGGYEARYR